MVTRTPRIIRPRTGATYPAVQRFHGSRSYEAAITLPLPTCHRQLFEIGLAKPKSLAYGPPMPGEARLRYSILINPRLAKDGGGYIASAPDWPAGLKFPPPTATGSTAAQALANLEAAMADWLMTPGLHGRPPPSLTVVPKD